MINSAIEWAEIFFFSLIVGAVCSVLVLIALVMGCGYLLRALFEMNFKWVVE